MTNFITIKNATQKLAKHNVIQTEKNLFFMFSKFEARNKCRNYKMSCRKNVYEHCADSVFKSFVGFS